MSISEFVRRPVPLGLRRARGSTTAVSAARPAAAAAPEPGGLPVLRLICNLTDERANGLDEAVLARLAGFRAVGTVVLDLGAGTGLNDVSRQALCELRAALQRRGTGLRLVVTSREARSDLAAAAGPDVVHDCARAAMLAAFAQAPGPGLVGAAMREALAAPPDAL